VTKKISSLPGKIKDISDQNIYSIQTERISLSILATFVLPTFIAIWAGVFKGLLSDNTGWWWVVLVGAILCQLFLSIILLSRKNLINDTYYYARQLLDQVGDLKRQNDSLSDVLTYYTTTSKLQRYWAILASYLIDQNVEEDSIDKKLREYVGEMFNPVISDLGGNLFGYIHDEKWNYVLYLYEKNNTNLVSFWRAKSPNHPSGEMGRSWKTGEGHVGQAFGKRKAVITSDATEERVRDLSEAPTRKQEGYDKETYVSFAAIPVMKDADEPIGVLVVTSNIKNRFDKFNSQILQNASTFIYNAWAELQKRRT